MRPMAIVLCCCAALAVTRQSWAQEPPYEAVVVDDQVVARSGPGRQYYPTSKLPRGTKVRVLRHDYGGWYAVSPPEGSFSWVDSRYVEDHGGGVGVVRGDNVVVRIGSSVVGASDMLAGVQLSSNQKVRILGSTVLDAKSGARYYKIEPVRGEERWIAGRSLAPENAKPVSGPMLTHPDQPQDGRWQSNTSSRQVPEPEPAGHSAVQAAAPQRERDVAPEEPTVEEQPEREGSLGGAAALHGTPRDEPPLAAERDDEPVLTEPDPALAVLQDAHRRLAQGVGQNIATWDLEPARELYRRALLQARSPDVRFAARQGLERVQRYAALKENYDGFQRAKARAEGHLVVEHGGPRLIAPGETLDGTAAPQPGGRLTRRETRRGRNGPPDGRTASASPAAGPAPVVWHRYPYERTAQVEPPQDRIASLGPVTLPPRAAEPAPPPEQEQERPIEREPNAQPAAERAAAPQSVPQGRRAASLVSRLDEVPRRAPLGRPAAAEVAAAPAIPHAPVARPLAGEVSPIAPGVPPTSSRVALTAPAPADQPSAPLSSAMPAERRSQPVSTPEPEGRHDGAGTLLRTAMQGFRAPEYKLVDSRGTVRYYVSPALGTDLRPYLHQSVAVVGQVQYRADLGANHITVRQVIPLGTGSAGQQAALPISTNAPPRRYY